MVRLWNLRNLRLQLVDEALIFRDLVVGRTVFFLE